MRGKTLVGLALMTVLGIGVNGPAVRGQEPGAESPTVAKAPKNYRVFTVACRAGWIEDSSYESARDASFKVDELRRAGREAQIVTGIQDGGKAFWLQPVRGYELYSYACKRTWQLEKTCATMRDLLEGVTKLHDQGLNYEVVAKY